MRILLILSSLYTGGAEFSTLTFYGWLRKRGYDIKVVCYKQASPSYDPASFGLEGVITLDGNSFIKKWQALNNLLRSFQPALIHSVLFEANILARFCMYTNHKIIHLESLVNEVYSPHRLKDPNINRLKLSAYQLFDYVTQLRGVDHFHANGRSVANHYQKKLRIAAKRMTIVPRGRDKNRYVGNADARRNIRGQLGISNDTVVLISVGRHEFQKGQDTLLRALSQLNNMGKDFKCLIVGREGRFTPNLQNLIQQYGLADRTVLTGHRNDVQELLAAADIFVFPSRFEGLPGALIEAEAASLPIVCSNIPNNKEVGVDRENAFFFDVDDDRQLAAQLDNLITDRAKRENMAAQSLRIFNERFVLERVHEQMKALIDSLITRQ